MILKKVRYVPGLISLIGLPILLLLFGPEDPVQYTCLKLALPSNEIDITGEMFTETYVYNKIKNYKITEIDLFDKVYYGNSKDTYLSNKKLQFVQSEMERLQFLHDSTKILKVELGEDNSYGEFVWLINQAALYRFKQYVFIDDDLYFFANPAPVNYLKFPVESLYLDVPQLINSAPYEPPTKWEIFKRHFQYQFDDIIFMLKYNWLLSIGFLMLIFIPAAIQLLRRRKRAYL